MSTRSAKGPQRILRAVMAAALLAGACTTQMHTPSSDLATSEIKIKAGDRINIVTTGRDKLTLDVTEVRADRFVGITSEIPEQHDFRPGGENWEVPFDQIAVLWIRRLDPGAVARAAAVAVVTVSAVGLVIGVAAAPAVPLVVP
jgi:hypothetical protein